MLQWQYPLGGALDRILGNRLLGAWAAEMKQGGGPRGHVCDGAGDEGIS